MAEENDAECILLVFLILLGLVFLFVSFLDSLVFPILVGFLLFQISSFKFPILFGLGFLFKQGIFILLCLGFSFL